MTAGCQLGPIAAARKRVLPASVYESFRSVWYRRLWAAAVKLADKYGIHRTAKALQVDYYALKKRIVIPGTRPLILIL